MSVRNLEHLFRPSSVAVIGASDRTGSVGATVMRNLLGGGFKGPIQPINPRHAVVAGLKTVADVDAMAIAPDLAIICTPPSTIPAIVRALGRKGTKAAVILSAGLGQTDSQGRTYLQLALEEARPHLLRILGPNCVGLLIPGIALNASFAHIGARTGRLAFVAQSGALTTAMLDWAASRDIGFSHFISLGDSADVDFGDVLDYLATDPETHAILLYIESISHARKFMSAARAAARNKPIIAVKAGRTAVAAKAAASHTGALAGADDVYDAALRRAGILRVDSTLDLFNAAETLALARPFTGNRLAILTNGGGPGVMATDALVLGGGKLATISERSMSELNSFLPPTWSHGDPVDIIGDASAARYARSLQVLLDDPQADALLMIHAPTAIASGAEIAQACLPVIQDARRSVFSCWMGGETARIGRELFAAAGLPSYDTPEQAVEAFLQMMRYRRNQAMLVETPSSAPALPAHAADMARSVIESACIDGRLMLDESDAKDVLRAYGIPVAETRRVDTVDAAVDAATAIGFPVAMKILSPDVSHKSDVGGVTLDLPCAQAVRNAAELMTLRVRAACPAAKLIGFTVERMVRMTGAHEVIIGASTDPTFGPVILFGAGGTSVEVLDDKAVALPPLNNALARELVSRTRIAKVLAAHRNLPAANLDALCDVLIRVARMMEEIPQVMELDINPLLVNADGVMALDARIRIEPASVSPQRLAIRPYPAELESMLKLRDRQVQLRPIRPEDEPELGRLLSECNSADRHFRFFGTTGVMPHSQLGRYTQIDYDREMAFVAMDSRREMLGEVRAVADPDNGRAEFAILVRSDCQGSGLGRALLEKLVLYCHRRGTGTLYGDVLASNARMLALAEKCGFAAESEPMDGVIRVALILNEPRSRHHDSHCSPPRAPDCRPTSDGKVRRNCPA
ncbi:MAG: bifunctional acetate--CoA ligase family protein/GNAT family N-acetyltransferase [Betaproteobacteria bacterium]